MNKLLYLIIFVSSCFACSEETMEMPQQTSPSFSMDPISVIEGNNAKSIFVNLRLNKSASSAVNVTLGTVDGTATANSDYTPIAGQEIIFQAGDVQETIKLDIIGDEEPENDEFFTLEVIQINGATASVNEIEIGIENDDYNFEIDIPSSGYTTPISYANMDLIWSDEFEGEELNEDFWTYETGNGDWGWGNDELEYYRRDNTQLLDGHLVIQAREESFGGFQYTSSRLITEDKFEFTFGRVDVRAAIPKGQGIWPAIWMLGANISDVGWPRCGEIDIMELVGHEASTIHGTVHYPNQNGDRIQNGTSTSLSGGQTFDKSFHVFSLIWTEDRIEWYLDDVKFHTVTKSILGSQNPYPFNDPFYFILNVAVGGNWPGSPDASTIFPQNMIVDYIRVFQDN